jgi:serine phosphatase RsbU (regulator of sigma subunit)
MNEEMDPFGEDRIMDSLSSRRDEPLDDMARGLLADIRRYVGGAEQYDDMTFLFMRVE